MCRPSDTARSTFLLLVLASAVLLPASARGVVISFPDGTTNTAPFGFVGWDYVGQVNGLTATYLGNGWVITAGHVGPGDLVLDGSIYPLLPGWEQTFDNGGGPGTPDLLMFQVFPRPSLPPLALRSAPLTLGDLVVMIGCGRDRGTWTSFDPNGIFPPDEIYGWTWLSSQSKRWGTNVIESFPIGLVNGTVALATSFDEASGHLFEAQGADGDSGGAVFTVGASGMELAGILYAIGPAIGQPSDTSLFTNQTFAARMDFYHDQVQDALAMPEPGGGLGWGLGLLVLLGRRAHRSQK